MSEIDSIEERITQLFQELVAGLPQSTATLTVRRSAECYPEGETDGVEVELLPTNEEASPIWLAAKNRDIHVYLVLGKGAPLEIFPGRRRNQPGIDQVRDVCNAVIEGRLEETVWYLGSKLVKSDAKLYLQDKTERLYWIDGIYWFRRKTKKHIVYAPYVAESP